VNLGLHIADFTWPGGAPRIETLRTEVMPAIEAL
jgi:hypothetical protein